MTDDKDRPIVRDFGTDVSTRYPREFLRPTGTEGRSYEDLQIPDKLRLREILRRWDDLERLLPTVETMIRSRIVCFFKSASTEYNFVHNLSTIPDDFIQGLGTGTDMVVYRGSTPWTRTYVYLKSSAIGTVTIYPIIYGER